MQPSQFYCGRLTFPTSFADVYTFAANDAQPLKRLQLPETAFSDLAQNSHIDSLCHIKNRVKAENLCCLSQQFAHLEISQVVPKLILA